MNGQDDLSAGLGPALIGSQRFRMMLVPVGQERDQITRIPRQQNFGAGLLYFAIANLANPFIGLFHRHLSRAWDTYYYDAPFLYQAHLEGITCLLCLPVALHGPRVARAEL